MNTYDNICEEIVRRHQRARKTLRKQPGLAWHWYRAGLREALDVLDDHYPQLREELQRAYRAGRNHKKYISAI